MEFTATWVCGAGGGPPTPPRPPSNGSESARALGWNRQPRASPVSRGLKLHTPCSYMQIEGTRFPLWLSEPLRIGARLCIYEDTGSSPGPAQWVEDPAVVYVGGRRGLDSELLWLWCRPAATALMGPLAWELPFAAGVALKI